MTEREQNILRNYLAPHARSHWEWTEDGSAIVWADSRRTIAFREEIATVLGRLAPRGLSDFAAIVTLMAACRDNWAEEHSPQPLLTRYSLLDASESATRGAADLVVATVLPLRIHQDAKDVTEELDRIAQFPAELRQSLNARAVLAEAAFESADILLEPEDAASVASALKAGVSPGLLIRTSNPDENYGRLVETLEALQRGLPRIDETSIRTRLRTSLDALPRAAEDEIPIPQRARQFMASLRTDTDLAALAQLAMHVLAALQMPRRLNQSDDLPVGGVSDLTNRGTFDRLLISELAQDDLTLTVRVAMNEALYLRREVPAKAAPITRSIILDLGIRMWGLPRVYAVAVALALIASAQEHASVEVLLADGRDLRSIDLLTREGLLNTLSILHTAAHPGEAIPQLQRRCEVIQGASEAILITHEDVLHDSTFAPLLTSAGPLFVATVTRDGSLRLYEHSPAGGRKLSEATLDVSKILSPPEPAPMAQPAAPVHPDLPAFVQIQPVPLRMPVPRQGVKLAESRRYNLVGITQDRRFIVWDDPNRGARELVSELPSGRIKAICVDDPNHTAHLVIINRQSSRIGICSIRLDTRVTGTTWVPGNGFEAVWYQSGSLLFLHRHSAESLHLATLTRRHRAFGRSYRWLNSRYYHGPDGTYAVTMPGDEIRLERISTVRAIGVAESPEGDLYAITPTLAMTSVTSGRTVKPPPGGAIGLYVLAFGSRGIIARADYREHKLAAVEWSHGATWQPLDGVEMPDGDWRQWLFEAKLRAIEEHDMSLRSPVSAIGHSEGKHLWLQIGDQYVVVGPLGRMLLTRNRQLVAEQAPPPFPQTFVPFSRNQISHGLRTAQWPDGSKAFADPRGMVHLISSDSTLPQITLLLTNPYAVWTSDGRSWGSAYHGAGDSKVPTELLERFVRRLR